MKSKVVPLLAPLVLLACGSSTEGSAGTIAEAVAPAASSASSCAVLPFSSPVTHYPVQIDENATYYMTALPSDAATELVIHGTFPEATYGNFTVYDRTGAYVTNLIDSDIDPDRGSTNPTREGSRVLASPRDFTLRVLPAGSTAQGNELVAPAGGGLLVYRVYERFDGSSSTWEPPTVTAVVTGTKLPASCPALEAPELTENALVSAPPPAADGSFSFYLIPPGEAPYPDGKTGYLLAALDASRPAVVAIPAPPTTFDSTDVTERTVFHAPQVRYFSLGSYGPSFLTRNVTAGDHLGRAPSGAVYVVVGPASLRDTIEAAGLDFLPLSSASDASAPYLVYRNKAPQAGYPGAFTNIAAFPPCPGSAAAAASGSSPPTCGPLASAPPSYAAENYIGDAAPRGRQCSTAELLRTGCGFPEVAAVLAR